MVFGPVSPRISCGIWSTTPPAPTFFPEAPVPGALSACHVPPPLLPIFDPVSLFKSFSFSCRRPTQTIGNITVYTQDSKSQTYSVPSAGPLPFSPPIHRTAEQLHICTAQNHLLPYDPTPIERIGLTFCFVVRRLQTARISLLPTVSKITLNSCREYLEEQMFENSGHASITEDGDNLLRVEEAKRQFGDTAARKREQDPLKAGSRSQVELSQPR
ncbi:hypothetical protein K438DRAFT_1767083 [Mycena galopus ATCC 62051]|nr:hypothetical protein K438DRAFT_1767083 [Mycena galopus ATCC 62051]